VRENAPDSWIVSLGRHLPSFPPSAIIETRSRDLRWRKGDDESDYILARYPPKDTRTSLNFSPIGKIKAALRGIKVVSAISYAKGEERPYGNRVYNRTNGISATGAAPSDREI